MKVLNQRQLLGLLSFASRYPLRFFRADIKKAIIDYLQHRHPAAMDDEDFADALATARRLPDAVAFPDGSISKAMGLKAMDHVLLVYVKRSSELTLQTLEELSDLYDLCPGEDAGVEIAAFVVDGYGEHVNLDLGGVWCAFRGIGSPGMQTQPILDVYSVRAHSGLMDSRVPPCSS